MAKKMKSEGKKEEVSGLWEALAEFKEQWGQLARVHARLLRDANETSARHRRTAEILECYREDMAQRWEGEIERVESGYTPGGRMRFDADKGWRRNEDER